MSFALVFAETAEQTYANPKQAAESALANRKKVKKKRKASQQEGLFKQVFKTLELLSSNPRHPGLQTHEYSAIPNPYKAGDKVFEAYVQNKTPGAYRVFWCYGPNKQQITIIAITPSKNPGPKLGPFRGLT